MAIYIGDRNLASGGSGMDETFVKNYLIRYLSQYGFTYTQETPLATMLDALYMTPTEAELPGPKQIIHGTRASGYYGVVSPSEFGNFANNQIFNGQNLCTQIGLTEGTLINGTTDWLKFSNGREVIYIPQKPIRHTVSWNSIALLGAVFGAKKITIGGIVYAVTLLKGVNNDIDHNNRGDSEWDRLIIPLTTGVWGSDFDDASLGFDNGNGSWSWCQEVSNSTTQNLGLSRIRRGGSAASGVHNYAGLYADTPNGFRPALRVTL